MSWTVRKRCLACVSATLFLCLMHFLLTMPLGVEERELADLHLKQPEVALLEPIELKSRLLAQVFELPYPEDSGLHLDENEAIQNQQSLMLKDVEVRLKAISTRGELAFIELTYHDSGEKEPSKKKLNLGDELLGYTLETVSSEKLVFQSEEERVVYELYKKVSPEAVKEK